MNDRPWAGRGHGTVAIVGGGLAGFVAYQTLRAGGLEPREIVVFDPDPDPAAPGGAARPAIRQVRMRSESDGHCLPEVVPGPRAAEAVRRGELMPLVQTACNRYRPSVDEFLRHVEELRATKRLGRERRRAIGSSGSARSTAASRSSSATAVRPGRPDTSCSHWAIPGLASRRARRRRARRPRVRAARYARRVAIVGAGMAAATEWLNALAAGAQVVSVRRRDPLRRPLNLPRPLFSRRGLARFHATRAAASVRSPRGALGAVVPARPRWDEPLERRRRGPLPGRRRLDGEEQVICATGFRRGFAHDPLLARLVDEHGLETHGRWIVLAPDSTVPALTDGGAHARGRGCPRPVGVSRRRTRSSGRSTRRAASCDR